MATEDGVRATEIVPADVQVHGYADEPLLKWLNKIISMAVRLLAILMTVVIIFGVLDVVWLMYERLKEPPFLILRMTDILTLFGAFLGVLIAMEIFINITIYLREDVIHVKIVMATALMAIARKVIILDFKVIEPQFVYATAAVVLAMSIGYWLVVVKDVKAIRIPGGGLNNGRVSEDIAEHEDES